MDGIFDTHAHYDSEQFDQDRDETLLRVQGSGVSVILNCGCDEKSSKTTVELCHRYPFIFGAVGMHPSELESMSDKWEENIRRLLKEEKIVAVGEIGLDYHYDFSEKEKQLEVFERQLIVAKELDMPVIVHDREAHADTMALLQKYRPKGVLHCFSGSVEMAKEVIDLGMYIGVGGAVTFKNAKKPIEVVHHLPLDRLLLETDCPYMTPVPFRGKRNDSSLIPYTAMKIAEIKGVDAQQVVDRARENAMRLFFSR